LYAMGRMLSPWRTRRVGYVRWRAASMAALLRRSHPKAVVS
jgi:hypothetical protein